MLEFEINALKCIANLVKLLSIFMISCICLVEEEHSDEIPLSVNICDSIDCFLCRYVYV